ncbi:uncharacterized protein BX663DRAFT_171816 [Cokeromyces recurvatus]|uniref:uncharacterized protein n=1 Tax=Cokeromyces recurvatus TaxID=90255 RepID=UPI0022207B36|nr:uncharacterized protein BX663DRAFT_171816 [Cokeromyces recurvatus]KAI7899992.1 hypothetical protein BX663DRAFT_171816 [Cokeromyces recurvatus]
MYNTTSFPLYITLLYVHNFFPVYVYHFIVIIWNVAPESLYTHIYINDNMYIRIHTCTHTHTLRAY